MSRRAALPEPSSRLERTLAAAVLLLLFWLPLPFGSNRDWANSLLIVFCGLLATLIVFQLLRAAPARKRRTIVPTAAWPPILLLFAVQLWVFAQWSLGLSEHPGATFRSFLLGSSYALLFYLVVVLFNTRRRLTLLLVTLIASGTLQAFYGAFMTMSGIEWLLFTAKEDYLGVVTGTFVNRNHLAGYLELSIACAIGLMLALRDGQPISWRGALETLLSPKIVLRLCIVIMVIALVMTRSRMGNTAFFASLLIIGSLFVLLNKQHRLRNCLILASFILIDILVISQFFGLENLRNRLEQTYLETVVEDGRVVQQRADRLDISASIMPMAEARLISGFGAGTFETVYTGYAGPEIRADYDHAHNDYLQFLSEFGLIGMVLLALFVIYSLWQSLKALWRRESYYRSGVGFGASMGIIALMIHSFTDFNLQIPANAATFIVLCAIAVLANTHPRPKRRRSATSQT